MPTRKKQIIPSRRRRKGPWVLFLLLVLVLFHNASCTMFLIKEGVKEVKKLEREKKERQEQQREEEEFAQPSVTAGESPRPYHHGRWTPQREE
ncbi:MAG: hypothetical protein JW849_04275 [Phycisphaerae bacterium]|nr:hypothetical protein [Phycisphaerae bacterium]